MNKIITPQHHARAAANFARDVVETPHYIFTGYIESSANVTDDFAVSASRRAIEGRRITADEVKIATRRVDWVANTHYPFYNSKSSNTAHVVAVDGSTYRVYLCVQAANGASTVKPTATTSFPFTTLDGYKWQYLYTVSNNEFVTNTHVIVEPNANVAAAAVEMSVGGAVINDGGVGYTNHFTGAVGSQAASAGPTEIIIPSTASSTNDFYNACIIRVTDVNHPAFGEYKSVVDYVGATRKVIISSALSSPVTDGTEIEILPQVIVAYSYARPSSPPDLAPANMSNVATCNSASGVGCNFVSPVVVARISGNNNSVTSTEVLNAGRGIVVSPAPATVFVPSAVTRAANVSIIASPVDGYGANVFADVDASSVIIKVPVSANSSPVYKSGDEINFSAIVRNPKIDGIVARIATRDGIRSFVRGDTIVTYDTIAANVVANTVAASYAITGNSVGNTIVVGSSVLIANNSACAFANVVAVINSSAVATDAQISPSITAATISVVKFRGIGRVIDAVANAVSIDSFVGDVGRSAVDQQTRRRADIVSFTINGRSSLSQLVGADVIIGTNTSAIAAGETITSPSGSATIWNVKTDNVGNAVIAASATVGTFIEGNTATTNTSTVTITAKYPREYRCGSGELIYTSTFDPVAVSNTAITVGVVVTTK